jgi:acyl-coenzyme A thioesterase PaaI-like protein
MDINYSRYHLITASSPSLFFDSKIMRDAKLIDGSLLGRASFTLLISPDYGNINGVMHGGAAGVIFDMCTTVALAPLSRPGYWE